MAWFHAPWPRISIPVYTTSLLGIYTLLLAASSVEISGNEIFFIFRVSWYALTLRKTTHPPTI